MWLFNWLANRLAGMLGLPTVRDERITYEDIVAMTEAGARAGVLDENEQQVIANVFELDSRAVSSVMTLRDRADCVISMDADLQDSPDEIPELYRMITEDGYDLVSGWKKKRYDPLSKTIPTKLFNATARKFSGIKNLHDFNCGLKAYKNVVIKNIEVYNDMHRYIPYLAKIAGFHKIGEKVVKHQARKYGTTKFGLDRFVNGYLDLITLWFTSKFGKKPMHFFGLWGSAMFFIGFIALVIVLSMKLISMYSGDLRPLVTSSPYFYISLTAMILGTQMFLAGFIGELISRNSPNRNNYKIEDEI